MELNAEAQKSFTCQYCGRQFGRREHVQRHERTHTKHKPFKCSCGKAFTRRDLLRRHEKLAHHRNSPDPGDRSVNPVPQDNPGLGDLAHDISVVQQPSLNQQTGIWESPENPGMQLDINSMFLDGPHISPNNASSEDNSYTPFHDYDLWLDNADLSFLIPQTLDTTSSSESTILPQDFGGFTRASNNLRITDVNPGVQLGLQHHGQSSTGNPGQNPVLQPCWKINTLDYRQIVRKVKSFSDVLPKDFSILSRHTMSRFIEGCVKGFCEHFPFLHTRTFSAGDAEPELVLSMAAIGAQFRMESHRKLMLFDAAKAVMIERVRRRDQNSRKGESHHLTADDHNLGISTNASRDEDRVQTLQASLCLLAMGLWGPSHLLQEGISLQNFVVRLVREEAITNEGSLEGLQDTEFEWRRWVRNETRKRTRFVAYSLLNLMSLAYQMPPPILNSEMQELLPAFHAEWNAKSAPDWKEYCRLRTSTEGSFQSSFEALFQKRNLLSAKIVLPSFAYYTLIIAILQHIFLRREMLLSSNRHSINSNEIEEISRALQCWQACWERSREKVYDDQSVNNPIVFNSTALLRLGWLRLHADLGPCRNLASREPGVIASTFNSGPPIIRSSGTIQPALQAVHALAVPVRMGVSFVARTQTISWSVQLSLSNLECAIFLCKWLEQLALTRKTNPIEKQELKLIMVIDGLLQETGLFEDEAVQKFANAGDQDQKLRKLATGVAKLWAEVFKGMHVFELVDTIGASLAVYAELMERACSPEISE